MEGGWKSKAGDRDEDFDAAGGEEEKEIEGEARLRTRPRRRGAEHLAQHLHRHIRLAPLCTSPTLLLPKRGGRRRVGETGDVVALNDA